jgi:predicted Rossmann-fold nucleotide-binding protein
MFVKIFTRVCVPSGFGTLDKCFEAITLIQTKKIIDSIILVGTTYWSGWIDGLKRY